MLFRAGEVAGDEGALGRGEAGHEFGNGGGVGIGTAALADVVRRDGGGGGVDVDGGFGFAGEGELSLEPGHRNLCPFPIAEVERDLVHGGEGGELAALAFLDPPEDKFVEGFSVASLGEDRGAMTVVGPDVGPAAIGADTPKDARKGILLLGCGGGRLWGRCLSLGSLGFGWLFAAGLVIRCWHVW